MRYPPKKETRQICCQCGHECQPVDKMEASGWYRRPMSASEKVASLKETRRLLDIVRRLRKECPWDRKQTHKTLIPYLIEEAYETVDAIRATGTRGLREELGDLLLQVALHSEIASERGDFSFEDVAQSISKKMIHRHPHVFSKVEYRDLATHLKNWTRLKQKEKPKQSLLEGIPKAMPGLQIAQRYGEIASSVGFDWKVASKVVSKIKEELGELERELRRSRPRKESIEMELGDLLFTVADLARHLRCDAETAVKRSSSKFYERFNRMESMVKRDGGALEKCTPAELERYWEKCKQ